MNSRIGTKGAFAVAAVALGLLAGCGGDDDKDTTQATVTQTTTAPAPTTQAQQQPAQTQPAQPIQPMEQPPADTGGDDDVTREDIDQALHNELTQNQGFSEAMADCVIQYLTDHVTDAEYVDAFERLSRGETPDDFSDAGEACANA